MEKNLQKKLGAYYTPNDLVTFLCKNILKEKPKRILEPSFGDGIFLNTLEEIKYYDNSIDGVEIDKKTFLNFKKNNNKNIKLYNKNFLKFNKKKYDAIIGNPPFVRTRFLDKNQKDEAVKYYKEKLNLKSLSDPSLWLIFIYHSLRLLNRKGSLGFVLPYDFTFVSYALPLWIEIFKNFKTIEVHHTKKRYFNDILQDTILLICKDYKNSNNELNYFVYDKSINSTPKKKIITKSQIINNRRIFKYVLLPNDFFKIQRKISKKLIEVNKIVKFHIGYVSGNKKYFHPDNLTIKKYGITRKNIIKTIADTKLLKEIGVFTSNIKEENLNNLFYPIKISKPEQKYIDFGKKEKINNQHKCKIRNNWYMVPIVKVPDYVISVFNEFPLMVYNDKNLIATNTFLCGYSNDYKNKKILLNGWYNSLTKLFLELEIHSLGGGMLIMVPKEIGKIKIPFINKINKNFINKINKYIKENDYKKAMKIGDKVILNDFLQLNDKEIKIIHKSIKILQYWRNLK